MNYALSVPPVPCKFSQMTQAETKIYYEWFVVEIPCRIRLLSDFVKATEEFEAWNPDFSPSSLDGLGQWFATKVEVRPRTKEEMRDIKSTLPYDIEVPKTELTEMTFSLIIDIAMYFGEVFVHNHSQCQWKHYVGSKRDVEYGQPIISGFGRAPLHPTQVAMVVAYRLAEDKRCGGILRQTYEVWSARLN